MYAGRHKNPSPSGDKKHQQVFLLWNPSLLVTERFHSFQCIVFPFFVPLPEDTSQTSENFGLSLCRQPFRLSPVLKELVFRMASVLSGVIMLKNAHL